MYSNPSYYGFGLPNYQNGYFNYPQNQQNFNGGGNFQTENLKFTPSKQETSNQPRLAVIPVASVDEAKAIQTPFDGTTLYLVNNAKNEIYSKSLALDGSVELNTYVKSTVVEETEMSKLAKRIESLEKQLSEKQGKKKGEKDE